MGWLTTILGRNTSTAPAGSIDWPAVRATLRDALLAGLAVAAVKLCDAAAVALGSDSVPVDAVWIPAAMGGLALLRRWLVSYQGAK